MGKKFPRKNKISMPTGMRPAAVAERVWLCILICVLLNFKFFFIKIERDLYFLDRFDVLMLKIIFKK
jgi:hypothetical protein